MVHADGMALRFLIWLAVVLLLLGGLPHPAVADLFVSDHELSTNSPNQYEVRRFNDADGTVKPLTVPISPITSRGEGLAFGIINGVRILFVADTAGKINEYNPDTGQFIANFKTYNPAESLGGISLSKDGLTLYVAVQRALLPGVGRIDAFSTLDPNPTKSPIHSAPTDAAHDVRVGPDGNVYAADPFVVLNANNTPGVVRFLSDLSSPVTFVPFGVIGNPSGMTFADGNLWVSNFDTDSFNSVFGSVYEFDPLGNLVLQVHSTSFAGPVGLATGPDGNIYVANIRGDNVLKIDVSSCSVNNPLGCSVSEFIPSPSAGFQPKYPEFTFSASVPEPNSLSLLLVGMLGIAGATWRWVRHC